MSGQNSVKTLPVLPSGLNAVSFVFFDLSV